MKVAFCRSNRLGSWLIRLLTFSKWSHVAVVFGQDDTSAIEAAVPRVRFTTLDKLRRTHTTVEVRELDITPAAVLWMVAQVGKPYDFWALFAVVMPWRDWMEDDKWFCSELIARATGLFEDATRVTPQMLYLLSRPAK